MYDRKPEVELVRLTRQCVADSEKWFGDSTTTQGIRGLVHHSLALCGEAGELANVVKKIDRGSLDYSDAAVRNHLAMELTDSLVYILNIAGLLNIDLSKTYEVVRSQNDKRFMMERAKREARRGK